MTPDMIDVSSPLKNLGLGILLMVCGRLSFDVFIPHFFNNEVRGEFAEVSGTVVKILEIENQKVRKNAVKVQYNVDGNNYAVYVFSPNRVEISDKFDIEYDKENPKRCRYQGKKYMGQPFVSQVR